MTVARSPEDGLDLARSRARAYLLRSLPPRPPPHPFAGASGLLRRIGGTPLVRIRRVLPPGLPAAVSIWAKLEGHNPGGSVKDRAALAMILDARRSGRLRPGQRILDSSSGNTGIAEGMIGAALGHPLTLCLPRNANPERKRLLAAFGVDVIETDPLEGSDGALLAARELAARDAGLCYLDQYNNPANPLAHMRTTAREIHRQSRGRVTHFVAGLGTSGTFVGTTRGLKAIDPAIRCTSVEPDAAFHGLEGLKHMESAIRPGIYDDGLADDRIDAPTEESLALVPRLAREEGLLVGPSSGAALWAAHRVAERLDAGCVVTVFPDGGERYLSDRALWGSA